MIDTAGLPEPANAPPPRSCVRVERPEAGLVVLRLDPPHRAMPVFDLPMLRDLDLALAEIESDGSVRGLVIAGRNPKTFAAGADIDAIAAMSDPALVERVVGIGQALFERIAALSRTRPGFKSVAAIGGAAAGGACEIALACDLVIASDAKETRIGLPETQLGILPGWGGTTRLPRRIGLPAALDAILAGKLFTAHEARSRGIVDRLCAGEDLVRIASGIALGREKLARRSRGWAAWLVDKNPIAAAVIASQARKAVLAKTGGHYPAPLCALEIAVRAPRASTTASLRDERESLRDLAVGPVSKNLVRLFQLGEEAKKLRLFDGGTSARELKVAGVLGAGVMGRGIASLCADRGVATRLFDIAGPALDTALLEHRREVLERKKRRKLAASEADGAIDRLDVTRELVGFARSDIVIEAVAEKLEIKKKLFAELAATLGPDAILATNTSSLSVDAIAEGLPNPERIVGLHFFNPVKRMPLVEIVRGAKTSPRVVAECAALALRLGKTPVVVKDCAGFVVNRLLGPYLDEALRLLEAGVEPARLDRALRRFGMPMGPLELLDEVGFDIATHAARSLHAAYGDRMTPSNALEGFVAAKRLGKKTGLGFYRHAPDASGRSKHKSVLADDLGALVKRDVPSAASLTDDAIAERCVLAMGAEAARALEEQIVAGPRELDLATVYGMGFAPFRGGLARHLDTLGIATVVARLEKLQQVPDVSARSGGRARFEPCASLRALALSGRGFER